MNTTYTETDPLISELVIEPGRTEKNYWNDLWRYRELFYILSWRDIRVRYKQTVIGAAWGVIRPLLTMLIFVFVFGRLANLKGQNASTPYDIVVFAGLLPWQFFSNALSEGERYDAQVWCHKDGLHEFTHGEKVRGFSHGKTLPGGVLALKVAALCPEETALHLPLHGGILSLGDAIVRERGRLGFVPDAYMGDDPEGVKRGLRKAFLKHLREREFDHLLFAHGAPWIGGARAGLHAFLDRLER